MNRIHALIGVAILAVVTGCAKQEAPQAPDVDEPEETATVAPSQPVEAKPMAKDRAKAAADMIAFIDPSPQCQQYRDELAALGQTQGSIDDLSGPYVQAYKAGCVIKKQQ
jgi:PBP1b-binding outer membrane lipoprotein LpoB